MSRDGEEVQGEGRAGAGAGEERIRGERGGGGKKVQSHFDLSKSGRHYKFYMQMKIFLNFLVVIFGRMKQRRILYSYRLAFSLLILIKYFVGGAFLVN